MSNTDVKQEEETTPEESGNFDTVLAEELAAVAIKQMRAAIKFREEKLDNIQKSEEMYFNRKSKALRGRFNFPIPIMSGFVDTLLAKIDDEPVINFDRTSLADTIKAKKATAAWEYDSAPTRGAWAIKDILVKKLAIFSGRGIYKIFSESDPVYKNYFEIVDAFDFLAEPNGGYNLDNHLFKGQENIFRTEWDLEQGVTDGRYSKIQVGKLKAASTNVEFKRNEDMYMNRQRRFGNLGLEITNNNYVGQSLFSLTEWVMSWKGKEYVLFMDPVTGIWISFKTLEEKYGSLKCPWVSWATHYDAWNFWSKAPVDDLRPVAEALKTVVNFMFDDLQKRLWGQRFYDPEIITDASQLEWDRPDKIVMAMVPNGKRISDGVYQLPIGDNSQITVNVLEYFREFIGTESGITKGAKGNSDDKLLGVAQINMGEVADRLGLYNKFYRQAWAELGQRYLDGLIKFCTEERMVKMIGENGVEWKKLTADDLQFESDPDIRITGGTSQIKTDSIKRDQKSNALINAAKLFPNMLNAKIAVENILSNGQWTADEISPLLDVNEEGNEEESARAAQAVEDILKGKKPDLYPGATTRFMQHIIDFARKENPNPQVRLKLLAYAHNHLSIVQENMQREAQMAPPPSPDGSQTPNDNSIAGKMLPPPAPDNAPNNQGQ